MQEEKKDKRVDALLDSFNFTGSQKQESKSLSEKAVDKFVKSAPKEESKTTEEVKEGFDPLAFPDTKEQDDTSVNSSSQSEEIVVKNKQQEPESKSGTGKNFPLEKIKENLNPELKESLKKLEKNIPKETVDKLVNIMESDKNIIFNSEVTNVFENMSTSDASTLAKKLSDWSLPGEASNLNASVIIAWLNKTKK
ncbi:MAG: hypothetical protein ACK4IX_15245 [Candidatus Sericytochromatia bacterium]